MTGSIYPLLALQNHRHAPQAHERIAANDRAVESAVAAGADGKPAASLGKPAVNGRLPTGFPQRLGRRFAPPTATWKTLETFSTATTTSTTTMYGFRVPMKGAFGP